MSEISKDMDEQAPSPLQQIVEVLKETEAKLLGYHDNPEAHDLYVGIAYYRISRIVEQAGLFRQEDS